MGLYKRGCKILLYSAIYTITYHTTQCVNLKELAGIHENHQISYPKNVDFLGRRIGLNQVANFRKMELSGYYNLGTSK